MTGNEYQALAMRTNDRKATERISDKFDLLKFCKITISHLRCKIMTLAVFSMLVLDYPARLESSTTLLKNGFSTRNSLILTTQRKKLEIFVGILQCFANPSAGAWMKSCK